jgi:thymidylate synthase ThyX
MTHAAKVLADSISPDGVRLTTLEVTFPRIVLAEYNTHRAFSRNSASSRAIPTEKMLRMVQDNPYVPTHWGKNQKGMQAEEEVTESDARWAETEWRAARDRAVESAQALLGIGIHKQITNRLLEPFMWHTCITTSTEWANWDHLRRNEMAHPEIRLAAERMHEAMEASTPKLINYGAWHLPLLPEFEEVHVDNSIDWVKVSVARCARVSYLTHEGKRDIQADLDLYDRLLTSGHMSPFEHVARPMSDDDLFLRGGIAGSVMDEPEDGYSMARLIYWCGNFRGWVQLRKTIPNEHDILGEA